TVSNCIFIRSVYQSYSVWKCMYLIIHSILFISIQPPYFLKGKIFTLLLPFLDAMLYHSLKKNSGVINKGVQPSYSPVLKT
ncbi:MAG: hypothetical protein KA303_04450, partial [Paludibacter sp.]|nr:hypothetical protein [Paludibacter sp.]